MHDLKDGDHCFRVVVPDVLGLDEAQEGLYPAEIHEGPGGVPGLASEPHAGGSVVLHLRHHQVEGLGAHVDGLGRVERHPLDGSAPRAPSGGRLDGGDHQSEPGAEVASQDAEEVVSDHGLGPHALKLLARPEEVEDRPRAPAVVEGFENGLVLERLRQEESRVLSRRVDAAADVIERQRGDPAADVRGEVAGLLEGLRDAAQAEEAHGDPGGLGGDALGQVQEKADASEVHEELGVLSVRQEGADEVEEDAEGLGAPPPLAKELQAHLDALVLEDGAKALDVLPHAREALDAVEVVEVDPRAGVGGGLGLEGRGARGRGGAEVAVVTVAARAPLEDALPQAAHELCRDAGPDELVEDLVVAQGVGHDVKAPLPIVLDEVVHEAPLGLLLLRLSLGPTEDLEGLAHGPNDLEGALRGVPALRLLDRSYESLDGVPRIVHRGGLAFHRGSTRRVLTDSAAFLDARGLQTRLISSGSGSESESSARARRWRRRGGSREGRRWGERASGLDGLGLGLGRPMSLSPVATVRSPPLPLAMMSCEPLARALFEIAPPCPPRALVRE